MATATRRLGLMTARALRLLTDAATLTRKTTSQDGSGGEVDTISTLGPFACRLEAKQTVPLERLEGGRLEAVTVYTLYLPHGTNVLPADQATVTAADTGASVTFEVVDSTDAATDGVCMAVSLRRVH